MTLAFPKPEKRPPKPRKALVRTRMKRRPPRRLKRAGSNPGYLAWVRGQRCLIATRGYLGMPDECAGRIHAHHAGPRPGVGMKAPDDTAIPFCSYHHTAWHDATGIFAGLSRVERAGWSTGAIAATQAAWSRA